MKNYLTRVTQTLVSLCDRWYCRGGARSERASSFSASALFSECLRGAARLVKTDIIASLILHANIAKITAQELSLSCFVLCII